MELLPTLHDDHLLLLPAPREDAASGIVVNALASLLRILFD